MGVIVVCRSEIDKRIKGVLPVFSGHGQDARAT
jgi:hypothetical protein